jgi:hypothetical protein
VITQLQLILLLLYVWYIWIFTKGRIQSIRWWLFTPITAINTRKLLWILMHNASWTAVSDANTSCSYCRCYCKFCQCAIIFIWRSSETWEAMKLTERHFTLALQHGFLCWNPKFKLTRFYEPHILENERGAKIRCAKRATSFDVLFAGGSFPQYRSTGAWSWPLTYLD